MKSSKARSRILSRLIIHAFALALICNYSFAQNAYAYDGGTNWQSPFYDIIKENDPSTFKRVSFEREKNAEMWDREANNNKGAWIQPKSWIFQLTYDDGFKLKSESDSSDLQEVMPIG